MKIEPKRSKRLTPAQMQARLANRSPSWVVLLNTKLNRLSFPSVTQGAGKLTDGKRLAGMLRIMRHSDPGGTESPLVWNKTKLAWQHNGSKNCDCFMAEVGRRLEKAILECDSKFMADFRKTMSCYKAMSCWRDVYWWMLSHYAEIEACHAPFEIWRLVKEKFSLRDADRSNFLRTLRDVGLPVSKPFKKRNC